MKRVLFPQAFRDAEPFSTLAESWVGEADEHSVAGSRTRAFSTLAESWVGEALRFLLPIPTLLAFSTLAESWVGEAFNRYVVLFNLRPFQYSRRVVGG